MGLPTISFDDEKHEYRLNGQRVPSVSEILGQYTGGPPAWWGMRTGFRAVRELIARDKLTWPGLMEDTPEACLKGTSSVERIAKKERVTCNDIADDAKTRGTLIHDAVNKLGIEGTMPQFDEFLPEYRGYIRALSRWWVDQEPDLLLQELFVFSVKRLYAGRLDLVATFGDAEHSVLVDFKTNARVKADGSPKLEVLEKHKLQVVGYRAAFEELEQLKADEGAKPFDIPPIASSAVVILHESGEYLMQHVTWPPDEWNLLVQAFHARCQRLQRSPYKQLQEQLAGV